MQYFAYVIIRDLKGSPCFRVALRFKLMSPYKGHQKKRKRHIKFGDLSPLIVVRSLIDRRFLANASKFKNLRVSDSDIAT